MGVWTVNSAGEMRRMAVWGVDAITTDDSVLLKQVLGRWCPTARELLADFREVQNRIPNQ
jgi:hypothetical protein